MVKKIINSLKREGILKTTLKGFRFVKWKLTYILNKKKAMPIIPYENFENVIIFENNFGWKKLIKQRPQQIAENFSDKTLFIYHSHFDEDFKKHGKRVSKIKDNLYVVDLGYYRNDIFNDLNYFDIKKFLMIYSTDYIPEERIKEYKDHNFNVIYEYVDNIDKKLCGKMYSKLLKRHQFIIKDNSNIIITTATKLYDGVKKENKKANVTLVTNGVNYDHFHDIKCEETPLDLKGIKSKYKHIIGYYGALASWFDYGLINKLSKERPNDAIVLIGIDYDGSLGKSKIEEKDNIFYLGRKEYEELPCYLKCFDICMIPFLINEITLSTSPVKMFEYMAGGKPVVTTELPECKKYKSVLISKNAKEFLSNIDKAIKKSTDPNYIEKLNNEAKDNLWSNKCKTIEKLMSEKISRTAMFRKMLRERLSSGEIDRVVIWRSPFGWNVPLFQRPQHIANALSKKKTLVIYEVSEATDKFDEFDVINENLFLAPMERQVTLDTVLQVLDEFPSIPKYVQIYSTNWSMSGKTMQLYIDSGFKILYEYIDDLSPELAGTDKLPEYVVEKYNLMLKDDKNVLVVVTANEIEKDLISKRGKKNYCFSCNGVDVEHFRNLGKNKKLNDDFLKIINNGKINIGYYGALAKWFDYKLIEKINKTDKYNIILFGIKYDDAFDKSKIEKLDNVYFLGPKKYEELPYYASKIDVLTIPFVINSITQATSPLKLFEYMALQKPIVTTAMNECKKYKSVFIGNNHDEFIELLAKAYEKRNDNDYLELLLKEANDNSWNKKAEIMIELMKNNEKRS